MPTLSPISNPYREGPLFLTPKDLDVVHARVSSRDHAFVNSFFPCINGKDDKILSILYAKFVAELRNAVATNPSLEPGYGLDHPTHELLQRILEVGGSSSESTVQRPPTGRVAGMSGPQHDGCTTSGVHSENEPDAQLGPKQEGRDEGDGDGGKETTNDVGESFKSLPGNVTCVGPLGRTMNISETLAAKLNLKGIL